MFTHGLALRPATIRRLEREAAAIHAPPEALADGVLNAFLDELRDARRRFRQEARHLAKQREQESLTEGVRHG